MELIMMRLNGGLNLEKLKWLRKKNSKKRFPTFASKIEDWVLGLEPKDVRIFNAFHNRFGSQCLNLISCKNLSLKFLNQKLSIAIGFTFSS